MSCKVSVSALNRTRFRRLAYSPVPFVVSQKTDWDREEGWHSVKEIARVLRRFGLPTVTPADLAPVRAA